MPTFQEVVDAFESKRDSDYAKGRRQGLLEAAELVGSMASNIDKAVDQALDHAVKRLERLAGEAG